MHELEHVIRSDEELDDLKTTGEVSVCWLGEMCSAVVGVLCTSSWKESARIFSARKDTSREYFST